MVEAEEIISLIKKALPDAVVEIQDMRGDGDCYSAYVESSAFAGKSRLDQHRMVFAALQGRVGSTISEFSLKTAMRETEE